jgi:hypothetical protein
MHVIASTDLDTELLVFDSRLQNHFCMLFLAEDYMETDGGSK